MGRQDEIRERLHEMAKQHGPDHTMLGIVTDVDADNFECTIKDDDDLEYPSIRLRPVTDGTESLTLFPKVGSWALAIRIEGDEDWMLISAGEFDRWKLKVESLEMDLSGEGLRIGNETQTLKQALINIIDACLQIVVLQGTNPDIVKLTEAKDIVNDILR